VEGPEGWSPPAPGTLLRPEAHRRVWWRLVRAKPSAKYLLAGERSLWTGSVSVDSGASGGIALPRVTWPISPRPGFATKVQVARGGVMHGLIVTVAPGEDTMVNGDAGARRAWCRDVVSVGGTRRRLLVTMSGAAAAASRATEARLSATLVGRLETVSPDASQCGGRPGRGAARRLGGPGRQRKPRNARAGGGGSTHLPGDRGGDLRPRPGAPVVGDPKVWVRARAGGRTGGDCRGGRVR